MLSYSLDFEAKFALFYPLDRTFNFRLNEYRLKLFKLILLQNMNTTTSLQKIQKGFTLIELLVVIAVIGVLAGAIIVAINPTEQLARGRDTGKKSTTQQIANAVNAYYAANSGIVPSN
ncbi:MAG: hypothetical protein RLZZ455_1164, partial [Candidatus Parcubacteria bacterium]